MHKSTKEEVLKSMPFLESICKSTDGGIHLLFIFLMS